VFVVFGRRRATTVDLARFAAGDGLRIVGFPADTEID
jgi:hypothetical protein